MPRGGEKINDMAQKLVAEHFTDPSFNASDIGGNLGCHSVCIHGIGGRKAARFFTREERGKAKSKHCRRNRFWKLVNNLIAKGLTSRVAIDTVHEVYGQSKGVTQLLDLIGKDPRNGTLHERLRQSIFRSTHLQART